MTADDNAPIERKPTIVRGVCTTPTGSLDGFHLFDSAGRWVGVYPTYTRAKAEQRGLPVG